MKLREWPNKLGWDWRDYEVVKHLDGFTVRSDHRCMFVPFELTGDPEIALRICLKFGCHVKDLDELPYSEARAQFFVRWKSVPMERHSVTELLGGNVITETWEQPCGIGR